MLDALISGDNAAAVRMLQAYFGLDFSVDRIDFQGPNTWGVEWGIEIIAGKPWNMCYHWFETDGFAGYALNSGEYSHRAGGDTRPAIVHAIIWQKL
jgi:hypothetical protein